MVDLDKLEELAKRLKNPANVFYEYAADDGAMLREAAAAITSAKAEIERLKEALRPFSDAFEDAREKYSARYGEDWKIGLSNFDKMPDHWSMEKLTFSMGVFRRAAAAMGEEPRT